MTSDNIKFLLALTKGEHTVEQIARRLDWDASDIATELGAMETKGDVRTRDDRGTKIYAQKLEANPPPIEEIIK